jgi:putative oxidoreductase
MTITRLLARPMLASIFVVGGINALRNSEAHAAKAKPVTDRVVPLAQKAVPQAPIPTDPQAKNMQRLQFAKNTSVLGGLLLAGVDTEGKPGLAWRARRAAADVRREAKQVAKNARREAKLAKAQLT